MAITIQEMLKQHAETGEDFNFEAPLTDAGIREAIAEGGEINEYT